MQQIVKALNFSDNVSTSSSQEIRFSDSNDLEYVAIPRSNSFTEHSEESSIGAMENEPRICNQRNGHFTAIRDTAAAGCNLETHSLNSMPYELDSSLNSHSVRGCGKYINCSIL